MASDPLYTGRGVLSVSDFMQFASIGRTKLYSEIGAGRLRVRKVGRKTVIPASDAYAWVDSLPTVEVAFRENRSIRRSRRQRASRLRNSCLEGSSFPAIRRQHPQQSRAARRARLLAQYLVAFTLLSELRYYILNCLFAHGHAFPLPRHSKPILGDRGACGERHPPRNTAPPHTPTPPPSMYERPCLRALQRYAFW